MDFKELTKRYLSAQTTLEEEAELLKSRPAVSDTEGRAIEAMIYHAQKQRQESVAIRLHEPRRGWQVVAALAASVVMLLGIFLMPYVANALDVARRDVGAVVKMNL